MSYILDACALLTFLNDEEGAEKVEDLLNQSVTGDIPVSMSIVNLLEVFYGELRDKGVEIAQIVLDVVQQYSIKIIDTVSEQVFREAARLKVAYKVSIADCIGLATAMELSSHFVTSDHHELELVAENEPIPFVWLPPHPKSR
jgi:PIN domain nuclease of toxin-antitoxin system